LKPEKVLNNLTQMVKELNDIPIEKHDDDYWKKFHTFREAKRIVEYEINDKKICLECGEKMVCPKCHPVIEKTNSIIVRHKDSDYNGGYPNVLVITPMYTDAYEKSVSCATLTGDNFFHPGNKTAGYTYMERGTIEQTAHILANTDVETWCRLFGFPKNRLLMARDIQLQLRKYLGLEVI
jgi:hypothetical protein